MNTLNVNGIHTGSPIEQVLDHFEAVRQSGEGYAARCPAHEDRNPSLSIGTGRDGQVLLNCHRGCPTEDVLHAAGLEWSDLYPKQEASTKKTPDWSPWDGEEIEVYDYTDADGQPLLQKVRFEMRNPEHGAYGEKKFLQRAYRPEHSGAGKKGCPDGYTWKLGGLGPSLYRLPRVIAAVSRGEEVYFVEGEKDAHSVEQLGYTATCLSTGATGDGLSEKITRLLTEHLEGASVVCIPDNDAPGQTFSAAVAEALVRAGGDVRIVHLPGLGHKEDMSDWLDHGHTVHELEELVARTEPVPWIPENVNDLDRRCSELKDDRLIFDHIELLANLPLSEYAVVKTKLKESTGVNLNDLEAAVQSARKEIEERQEREKLRARRESIEEGSKSVVVVTGRHSPNIVDDACQAIAQSNDPTALFRRSGELVQVSMGEEGRLMICEVSEPWFDDYLARSAKFVDEKYKPRDLPPRLVARVIETVDAPHLTGITRTPVLRADGSVFSDPGYDEETGLLYRVEGRQIPSIPEDPTREEVMAAVDFLDMAWIDHPFADEASRANTFALALTLVLSLYLDSSNVPLAIIGATRAGSGKSLLAQIVGIMALGEDPATMSAPLGSEEWRKQITAQLRRGERFIVIDDVTGSLNNAPLRRAITSSVWSDRVLGASRQVRYPSDAVWCATGNNLRPRGDMVRRCFPITLDTEMVEPHLRSGFTHKQPEWTRTHSAQLNAALLILARAWIMAGCPEPESPILGSFETWCTVVGGILEVAGIEGFLDNLDQLSKTEFNEDDRWSRLLDSIAGWQASHLDGRPFTTIELAEFVQKEIYCSDGDPVATDILNALPEELQEKSRLDRPFSVSLGKYFDYRTDRRYPGGWYIKRVGASRDGTEWTIRRDVPG